MRRLVTLLIMVFVIHASAAFSQNRDSLVGRYDALSIYQFGNKFIKNNRPISYQELGREFTTPRTQYMYQKSRKKLVVARIFNLASLGVVVSSLFIKNKGNAVFTYAAGSAILGLGGFYFQNESNQYIQRAIWERNRNIIAGVDR